MKSILVHALSKRFPAFSLQTFPIIKYVSKIICWSMIFDKSWGHINALLGGPNLMRNNKVKVLLMNEFGENIYFSYPKQKNMSLLGFSRSCTTEKLTETIRFADSIKECATLIRKELMVVNFWLVDKFSDALMQRLLGKTRVYLSPSCLFSPFSSISTEILLLTRLVACSSRQQYKIQWVQNTAARIILRLPNCLSYHSVTF